jgi:hypothetical protein
VRAPPSLLSPAALAVVLPASPPALPAALPPIVLPLITPALPLASSLSLPDLPPLGSAPPESTPPSGRDVAGLCVSRGIAPPPPSVEACAPQPIKLVETVTRSAAVSAALIVFASMPILQRPGAHALPSLLGVMPRAPL